VAEAAAPLQVVYLHGFASSAQSSKARFFGERFAQIGVPLHTPDLNEPDFETLTVTRMIDQVGRLLGTLPASVPVVLMGSSLGALVAWNAAGRLTPAADRAAISRLVLLAPAVTFGQDRQADFGPGVVDAWERDGSREFFHYGYEAPRRLRFAFYADALACRADARAVSLPTLVFQGTRDEVCHPAAVQAFFSGHPTVRVRLLDDGHQLLDHLDLMWDETRVFLGV
jgi:uncharacterized protein